jgi:hypothetical protein
MVKSLRRWRWVVVICLLALCIAVFNLPDEYSTLRRLDPEETWIFGPASGQWRWGHPVHTFLFRQNPAKIGRSLGMSESKAKELEEFTARGFVADNGFTDVAVIPLPSGKSGHLYRTFDRHHPWALEVPKDEQPWLARCWSAIERRLGIE